MTDFSIKSKEHYDLMAQFEQEFKGRRFNKESKELWTHSVYQDGHVNEMFKIYRKGYVLGKVGL